MGLLLGNFMDVSFIISGFAVGILVGMTGVGGGSLMTPLLTLLFGVSPAVAVGTDLAFASLTKGVGTSTHRLRGTVRWDIVRLLCIGALPAAVLASFGLKYFGTLSAELGQVIRYMIACSVLLTVCALMFKRRMLAWVNASLTRQLHGRALAAATIFSGVVLGTLVTISSIGAGAIGATLLVMLYPRLTPAEVAGTDIAYAVPLTAIAAVGHWWLGSINWMLLLTLLVGSLPGITIGSYFAKSVPEHLLRGLLACTLVTVAAKLIM